MSSHKNTKQKVLAALLEEIARAQDYGAAVAVKDLSALTGVSRRSVDTAAIALEALGMVERANGFQCNEKLLCPGKVLQDLFDGALFEGGNSKESSGFHPPSKRRFTINTLSTYSTILYNLNKRLSRDVSTLLPNRPSKSLSCATPEGEVFPVLETFVVPKGARFPLAHALCSVITKIGGVPVIMPDHMVEDWMEETDAPMDYRGTVHDPEAAANQLPKNMRRYDREHFLLHADSGRHAFYMFDTAMDRNMSFARELARQLVSMFHVEPGHHVITPLSHQKILLRWGQYPYLVRGRMMADMSGARYEDWIHAVLEPLKEGKYLDHRKSGIPNLNVLGSETAEGRYMEFLRKEGKASPRITVEEIKDKFPIDLWPENYKGEPDQVLFYEKILLEILTIVTAQEGGLATLPLFRMLTFYHRSGLVPLAFLEDDRITKRHGFPKPYRLDSYRRRPVSGY